ncbi:MAG: helix-turn-helix transcriptional regulator [Janthinobacterium lividum]
MLPAKAWRTHLELTQAEVAKRMGVNHRTYAQIEAREILRKTLLAKVAAALGITDSQLDF